MCDTGCMSKVTTTHLERACDAACAVLRAWAYPSDIEQRECAVLACAQLGINYIETVAKVTEQLDGQNYAPGNAHVARFKVAQSVLTGLALRAQTEAPRLGILASGRKADALGRDPQD